MFDRNLEEPGQIRALCEELRDCVDHAAPILIDQEGGRVQRLRPPLARDWPAPFDFVAQAGAGAEQAMRLRYRLIAEELRALGIDTNCAPLVDVAEHTTHPFLRNRCYGTDAQGVTRIGRAVAEGLMQGGVYPVIKHVPGHGRAQADSHRDLPRVAADRVALSRDFAPFAALADLPMAMTAHIVYDALDTRPATLSPVVMDTIREEIGFQNLIMTDDISMRALTGDVAQNARGAIVAGCDAVLHCNGDFKEMRAVAEAAGAMTDAAQARAEAVLQNRPKAQPVDIAALTAELEALLNGRDHGG
ncbi:glycoside hydrolase family 3 N-terminal domain-containing protein [Salinihabitans flavidus]|uniref:glycoside hydrolase family 3 N-terminal domain-containing protein n=1 Tax=Salinihabitans flavidus TaxID=569882 RepID=UPI003CCBC354